MAENGDVVPVPEGSAHSAPAEPANGDGASLNEDTLEDANGGTNGSKAKKNRGDRKKNKKKGASSKEGAAGDEEGAADDGDDDKDKPKKKKVSRNAEELGQTKNVHVAVPSGEFDEGAYELLELELKSDINIAGINAAEAHMRVEHLAAERRDLFEALKRAESEHEAAQNKLTQAKDRMKEIDAHVGNVKRGQGDTVEGKIKANEQQLRQLRQRMETTTMTLAEEKKHLKDIERLEGETKRMMDEKSHSSSLPVDIGELGKQRAMIEVGLKFLVDDAQAKKNVFYNLKGKVKSVSDALNAAGSERDKWRENRKDLGARMSREKKDAVVKKKENWFVWTQRGLLERGRQGKFCAKVLGCGNHRCPLKFPHEGECFTCPLNFSFRCPCNGTVIRIPCGKDPSGVVVKCERKCPKKKACPHIPDHPCHAGGCPTCKESVCGKSLKCGCKCKSSCHGNSKCPPCDNTTTRECAGGHSTKSFPCGDSRANQEFTCSARCGKLLACGNHQCGQKCHAKGCDPCKAPCSKPRSCEHPCPKRCHSGPCPFCDEKVTIYCHCNTGKKLVKCGDTKLPFSCGKTCGKKMSCGHPCSQKCHGGACKPSSCGVLSVVRCKCGRTWANVKCSAKASTTVPCGSECADAVTKKEMKAARASAPAPAPQPELTKRERKKERKALENKGKKKSNDADFNLDELSRQAQAEARAQEKPKNYMPLIGLILFVILIIASFVYSVANSESRVKIPIEAPGAADSAAGAVDASA